MRKLLFLLAAGLLIGCSANSQTSEETPTLAEEQAVTPQDSSELMTTEPQDTMEETRSPKAIFIEEYCTENYADREITEILFVSLVDQRMYHYKDGDIVRDYIVSGAKLGAGNKSGSNQTPEGLHEICEKIGDEVPLGGILKGKKYTGNVADIYTDDTDVKTDHVTTRILSLCGLEPGKNKGGNVDSFKRYIYVHGTPEEGLLGNPASHGCIRMRNEEVIELYESVSNGTLMLILDQ